MCGACGERSTADWARGWFADPAARAAGAAAAARLLTRPGVRVVPRPGGWLVTTPTGTSTACGGLTELVAAVRPWGPPVPGPATGGPGRLSVPGPDARQGVVLRVGSARRAEFTAPDEAAARHLLARLAAPPWSLRYYLSGLTGVTAPWGGPPDVVTGEAADVLVWLEWARQAGALDDRAIAARCPLGGPHELDVEVRAGHVVRATTRHRTPRGAQ
ncbi:hypothetical protein [Prauserella muralis]|uniref:Uncharacterized protein n=1 Tax=Prauserella muralis TaxID=588067 RepID=A0A2V4B7T5_9PSEU|nr:hypothetical protein [Prauserella muralis]PXY31297.1 hypothetical protein BAY60_02540 [Prauserella muralis]TWE14389.1 hypothetical protein FHX69_6535 [Prauserella muralis]